MTLAEDTGGRSFFDLGDLSEAFKAVQDDTAGYYLLGYYTTNAARDGRWRAIRVRVSGASGAHVTFREGYYAPKDFGVYTTEDRERQLDDAMRSQAPLVELPIAVETSWFRLDRNQCSCPSPPSSPPARCSGRRRATGAKCSSISSRKSGRRSPTAWSARCATPSPFAWTPNASSRCSRTPWSIRAESFWRREPISLKFLARENESGRIGTFEDDLILPAGGAQPHPIELPGALQPDCRRCRKRQRCRPRPSRAMHGSRSRPSRSPASASFPA